MKNKIHNLANAIISKQMQQTKLFKHHQKPVKALNTRVINSGPFAV